MGWDMPQRIMLYPHSVDVKYFSIDILNIASGKQTNTSVGGSVTRFNFTTTNARHYCSFLQICVTPMRSAGVGQVRDCVNTSFERGLFLH